MGFDSHILVMSLSKPCIGSKDLDSPGTGATRRAQLCLLACLSAAITFKEQSCIMSEHTVNSFQVSPAVTKLPAGFSLIRFF